MQFTITIAALLAATGAAATPLFRRQTDLDTKVRVVLRNGADASETTFESIPGAGSLSTGVVDGPFTASTVEIDVGADVDPALRCAILAGDDVKLLADRGANTDDTFSDSTNGEWTFPEPVSAAVVICDSAFVANNRNADVVSRRQTTLDESVTVTLRSIDGLESETRFESVEARISTGVNGLFDGPFSTSTLEVTVGPDANPDLRCALIDSDNVQRLATRGENLDDTFSDGDNGEWTFDIPVPAAVVVCDQDFVANNRNDA